MKTPRVQDFDPNAKLPELGSPMDNLPGIKPPDKMTAKPQNDKSASPQVDKAAKPLDSKAAKLQSHISLYEKPDRYTTRLIPSLVKRIKQYALDNDMDDKDVVTEALNDYLAKRK